MIGLDTNVLVRHIVQDDPKQSAAATRLIESACSVDSPGIVTLIVLCELVWVLDRGYKYRRDEIAPILRKIIGLADLRIERSELAWRALNEYEQSKGDFADYLIGLCAKEENAEITYTFDEATADSELFRLIKF